MKVKEAKQIINALPDNVEVKLEIVSNQSSHTSSQFDDHSGQDRPDSSNSQYGDH